MINDHHDGHGLNEAIQVVAADPPGAGGASHTYVFTVETPDDQQHDVGHIQFQHGARHNPEATPGITDSCLIAVTLDRLRAFQAGDFPSRENALAITKLEEALMWLKQRANNRAKRGVLGHEKK